MMFHNIGSNGNCPYHRCNTGQYMPDGMVNQIHCLLRLFCVIDNLSLWTRNGKYLSTP